MDATAHPTFPRQTAALHAPVGRCVKPRPPPLAPIRRCVKPTPPPLAPVRRCMKPTPPPLAPVRRCMKPRPPPLAPVRRCVKPRPPPPQEKHQYPAIHAKQGRPGLHWPVQRRRQGRPGLHWPVQRHRQGRPRLHGALHFRPSSHHDGMHPISRSRWLDPTELHGVCESAGSPSPMDARVRHAFHGCFTGVARAPHSRFACPEGRMGIWQMNASRRNSSRARSSLGWAVLVRPWQ